MAKNRNGLKAARGVMAVLIALIVFISLLGFNNNIFSSGVTHPAETAKTPADNNLASRETVPCIDGNKSIPAELHIHPHLKIVINGAAWEIPENIGISPDCERVLHTHDNSGTIHVEPNFAQTFILGDFVLVWGEKFSREQILDYRADSSHKLTMTVDGRPSDEWESLVLKDKQEIVITYASSLE